MKSTDSGRGAEAAVAGLLQDHGFEIMRRNWRTRLCEIDLVAEKNGVIYFIEVKYRASGAQGDGFEYITARKLKQMDFAARLWVQENDWPGDYRLMAAAVSGLKYENIRLIEA